MPSRCRNAALLFVVYTDLPALSGETGSSTSDKGGNVVEPSRGEKTGAGIGDAAELGDMASEFVFTLGMVIVKVGLPASLPAPVES